MASNTSGLFGSAGYDLLNPRKLDNPFGAGGYFALNPVNGGGGGTSSGSGSSSGSAPPATTLTLGSGVPDYASLIQNDPAFMSLKNLLSAQGIGDAAHLRGAVQSALIQFGHIPGTPADVFADPLGGGYDAATAQQAESNPFSVLKRLSDRYQQDQASTKDQLAARGILSSGETGYQLGKLGQSQAGAQYDATNSLLGSIGTLSSQYAAGQQAAAQQLAQGAMSAESNAVAGGVSAPQQAVTASWDPSVGAYKDPTGNYYDPSGNPIAMPSAAAPPPPPAPSAPSASGGRTIQQLAPGQRPLSGVYGA